MTNEPFHVPECRWEQTTNDECEYRASHCYCPHAEHACTCPEGGSEVDARICPRCEVRFRAVIAYGPASHRPVERLAKWCHECTARP